MAVSHRSVSENCIGEANCRRQLQFLADFCLQSLKFNIKKLLFFPAF